MEGGRNNGVRERCSEMRTGDIGHFELERGGRRVERGRGVLSAVLCHERHLASIAEATAGEHPMDAVRVPTTNRALRRSSRNIDRISTHAMDNGENDELPDKTTKMRKDTNSLRH